MKCRADNGATYNFKSDESFLSFSKCCLILTTPLSTIYLWTSLKKKSCYLTKNLALKFIIYSNVCALFFLYFYFRWINGRCNTLNILISLYRRALTLQLAHFFMSLGWNKSLGFRDNLLSGSFRTLCNSKHVLYLVP